MRGTGEIPEAGHSDGAPVARVRLRPVESALVYALANRARDNTGGFHRKRRGLLALAAPPRDLGAQSQAALSHRTPTGTRASGLVAHPGHSTPPPPLSTDLHFHQGSLDL